MKDTKSIIQQNVETEIKNFLDEYIDISAIINDVIAKMDFQDAEVRCEVFVLV